MTWVLMRGLMRETRHWGEFTEKMEQVLEARGYKNPADKIVCLELPGVGKKRQERLAFSVEKVIEDLHLELGSLGHSGPFGFLGISLGALTGLQWQSLYPNQFQKLVLVNTSHARTSPVFHRLRPDYVLKILPGLLHLDPRKSEEAILKLVCNDPAVRTKVLEEWVGIRESAPWGFRALVEQLLFATRAKWLPAPEPNRYFFLGSLNDRMVDSACTIRLMQKLGAHGNFHPDAGHDLSLEEPDWVLEEMFQWLDGKQASGQSDSSHKVPSGKWDSREQGQKREKRLVQGKYWV